MKFILNVIWFLLNFVSTHQGYEKEISQTPILGVELTEGGFHRHLIYSVQFDFPLAGKECRYLLRQHLPSSVYISVDQLDDMMRLNKLDAIYPSFVDVEKPAEQSRDFEVFLKGVPKITDAITLPIHFRYHAPNRKRSFVSVDINIPTMFINCPEHEHHLMESELQIDSNTTYCFDGKVPNIKKSSKPLNRDRWIDACNWKYVKTDIKLKSPLRAEIPVGNEHAYPAVLYVTIIASWIVSLWTVYRTRRIPMTINAKLEEQRILQKKQK